MPGPQVNGDVSHSASSSAFLEHVLSYPVVRDGIDRFKSNQYGQRSIELGDSAFQTFGAPVVSLLAKPYQYFSPYVHQADSFGAKTLDRVDEQFPAIRKPTSDLYKDSKSLIFLPINKGLQGKDRFLQIYAEERKKTEEQTIWAQGKAAVTAAFVVTNDTISWVSSFLKQKKEESNHVVNEKINQ
ncbi:hypothetical protein S7711_05959 [Stachybotrys chartarum IBT 7711]|uniref:CAP20 n=1 Tax=Stachybotrys chartarum (strain CBS 109288 / IBT 7711) TaxID=1280523 RepID=A0A084AQ52_STACB|nr:hypothetical protein S7711_05959 [Stachybotrys chartarum IBT 7711]KFA45916.1 hypothetical protein S40293_07579 [Stachybotrys chartarum IBT 40293]KFA81887.1 hypothetical protein S40288_01694 [Stachybotrys chartarum IBT 40288]